MPFALYNELEVTMQDTTLKKDHRFIGNTAIPWEDSFLAIWYIESITDDIDINKLASKIVHEMFHAFQNIEKESRFPNEIKALHYQYNAQNLTLKHQENVLLVQMLEGKNHLFEQFLALRKTRHHYFNSEAMYEAKTEMIEGMALKIETDALKQLDTDAYQAWLKTLKKRLSNPQNLCPIRQISYDIGAALFNVLDQLNIQYKTPIKESIYTVSEQLIQDSHTENVPLSIDETIEVIIKNFIQKRMDTVLKHQEQSNHVIAGPLKLLGLDPMNCFGYQDKIYCPHFLVYDHNQQPTMLNQPVLFTLDKANMITQIQIKK